MGLPAPEIPTLHDDLWRSRQGMAAGRCRVISAEATGLLEGVEGAHLFFCLFCSSSSSIAGCCYFGAARTVPHGPESECTSAGHLDVSVNLGILIPDGR